MTKCEVCKHQEDLHANTLINNVSFCAKCLEEVVRLSENGKTGDFQRFRHNFKLDNLQLIEDTARSKGLV